jgi:hypothetical protein
LPIEGHGLVGHRRWRRADPQNLDEPARGVTPPDLAAPVVADVDDPG